MERIQTSERLRPSSLPGSVTLGPVTSPIRRLPGTTYGVRQFERFLEAHRFPTQIRDIERAHVEEFISDVLKRSKPWTAQTRYRDFQQFFRWLVDSGEIDVSPMEKMRKPKLTEKISRPRCLFRGAVAVLAHPAPPQGATLLFVEGTQRLLEAAAASRSRHCPNCRRMGRSILPTWTMSSSIGWPRRNSRGTLRGPTLG